MRRHRPLLRAQRAGVPRHAQVSRPHPALARLQEREGVRGKERAGGRGELQRRGHRPPVPQVRRQQRHHNVPDGGDGLQVAGERQGAAPAANDRGENVQLQGRQPGRGGRHHPVHRLQAPLPVHASRAAPANRQHLQPAQPVPRPAVARHHRRRQRLRGKAVLRGHAGPVLHVHHVRGAGAVGGRSHRRESGAPSGGRAQEGDKKVAGDEQGLGRLLQADQGADRVRAEAGKGGQVRRGPERGRFVCRVGARQARGHTDVQRQVVHFKVFRQQGPVVRVAVDRQLR